MHNLYLKTIREGRLEKLICVLGDVTTKKSLKEREINALKFKHVSRPLKKSQC